MSHLSTTLRVEASATAVFDLIADPARSTEWQTMLAGMGDITGRPGGIGSSYVAFYRVAGRKLTTRFVVTAAERPTLVQVNGTTTGGWARWTTMIEPAGGGCEIQVSLEYELPGEIVGSILSLLTGHRIEREFRKTYDNLRRVAEMLAAPAGAGVAAGVPAGVAAGAVGAAMGGSAALSLLADEVEVREPGRLATT